LIHCAAERRPDVADADPERAERLNVGVVKNLAGLCGKNGIGMIYISTDYVFDGTAWVEFFFYVFHSSAILSL
jgi:S-adenosylmethionine synthetase